MVAPICKVGAVSRSRRSSQSKRRPSLFTNDSWDSRFLERPVFYVAQREPPHTCGQGDLAAGFLYSWLHQDELSHFHGPGEAELAAWVEALMPEDPQQCDDLMRSEHSSAPGERTQRTEAPAADWF